MAGNNDIGSVSLLISADAAQLNNVLASAQSTIGGWVGKVNGMFSAGNLATALGGVGIAAVGAFAAVGGALYGAHLAVVALRDEMFSIVDESRLAAALNVPFENFQTMMFATRSTAAELSATLQTMGGMAIRAASGQSKALRPFAQIGIGEQEVRALSAGPADAMFNRVAEQLRLIGPGMRQAFAAEQLGVTSAMLRQINGDMQANVEEARQFGAIIGDDQVGAAEKAKSAFSQLGRITEMMWRQASVVLAPYIEMVNTGLIAALTVLRPVIQSVIAIFGGWYSTVAAVGQELIALFTESGIGAWAGQFTISLSSARNFFMDCVEFIGIRLAWLTDKFLLFMADFGDNFVIPFIRGFASITRVMADQLAVITNDFVPGVIAALTKVIDGMKAVASLDPTGTLTAQLDNAQSALNAIPSSLDSTVASMRNAANNGEALADNLIPANAMMRNMANVETASVAFFQRARARMNAPATAPGGGNDSWFNPALAQRGVTLAQQFENPLEKIKRTMGEINELLVMQNGLWELGIEFEGGYIDETVALRGMMEQIHAAESALQIGPQKFAQLAMQDSSQAAQLIYHRDTERADDPAERLRQIQERALAQQEIQTRNGEALLEIMRTRPELLSI